MNVEGSVSIGNEIKAAKSIEKHINAHGIYVCQVTSDSDGDNQAHEGIKSAQQSKPVPVLKHHDLLHNRKNPAKTQHKV